MYILAIYTLVCPIGSGVLEGRFCVDILLASHAFHTEDIAVMMAGKIPSKPSRVSFNAGEPE